ncbi:MAG: DUF3644 domain-containing protein [Acidimicrobiales bacterium]
MVVADGASKNEPTENEHQALAGEMFARWEAGAPKSALELEYWGDAASHGKRFTAYARRWLGQETERKSGQTEHIERLEALLRARGISPTDAGDLDEEYRLLAKARESGLAAVRIYNDPLAGFRSETFIVLMIIAWNSLFQAVLERDGVDYYVRDDAGRQVLIDGRGKVKETWELLQSALAGPDRAAMRANLDFFLKLRHLIAHRYLPALDLQILGEAQAMLLNFENVLVEQFGEEAALGDQLCVPLQLSGFRDPAGLGSLKRAQAQLPTDVQDFLCRHREEVSEDVLRSPEYALQVFFVPVTANRDRSADAVVNFVRPGEISPELDEELAKLAIVTKPKQVPVASGDLLRPSEVVSLVRERLPYRFTSDTHQRAWKYYKVRPATGSAEPEATEGRYCRWDRLLRGYGYTRAWVDLLVSDLSNATSYEVIVGFAPEAR